MPDKYKQPLFFVIIFLIFIPFIFIWQPYPFLRAGMFSTPVAHAPMKELFYIQFEKEGQIIPAQDVLPFNAQKINYISRSFVYENKSEFLLKHLLNAENKEIFEKASLFKIVFDQKTDTIQVARYER